MTEKQLYDWQMLGGADDVIRMVKYADANMVWSVAEVEGGVVLRVSSLEDTLQCKIRALSDPSRRQSKQIRDLADIASLVESYPKLWERLPDELKLQVDRPVFN